MERNRGELQNTGMNFILQKKLYRCYDHNYEQKDGFISEDFLDKEDDDSLVRTETVVTDCISIHARRRDCAYYHKLHNHNGFIWSSSGASYVCLSFLDVFLIMEN